MLAGLLRVGFFLRAEAGGWVCVGKGEGDDIGVGVKVWVWVCV